MVTSSDVDDDKRNRCCDRQCAPLINYEEHKNSIFYGRRVSVSDHSMCNICERIPGLRRTMLTGENPI